MIQREYLIDTYQEEARPAVRMRAQWSADACDTYGLTTTSSVVQGTRAGDMNGIDMRYPQAAVYNPELDLDVVVTGAELSRLRLANPIRNSEDDLEDVLALPTPNFFRVKKGPKLDAVSVMYGGREGNERIDFEIARAQSHVITVVGRTGLYRVMTPLAIMTRKLSAGHPKDVLGVLYGYVSAYGQRHEVVDMPEAQKVALQALDEAEALDPYFQPDWLEEPRGLRSHPAFDALR